MTDEQTLLHDYMMEAVEPAPDVVDRAHAALLQAIEDEDPRRVETMHRPSLRFRSSRLSGLFVAAGVVIVAVAICVPFLTSTSGPHRSTARAALKFRLTGDIEQAAWQVKGALGSRSYQLVCPTTQECFVTEPSQPSNPQAPPDGVVEGSHDGGQTWSVSLDVPGTDLVGLTCSSVTTCIVSGENFASGNLGVNTYLTTDAGASWVSAASPGASLDSGLMSCSSTSHCVTTTSEAGPNGIGIQALAEVTNDGGRDWKTYMFPGTFRPLQLQCVGQRCVALGEAPPGYVITSPGMIRGTASAAYSPDGGVSWSMGELPSADMTNGLSCADEMHCFGIEQSVTTSGGQLGPVSERVISSNDGGATWMPTLGNDPTRWLLGSISCPTPSECWITVSLHVPGQTTSQAYANYESPSAPTTFVKVTQDGGQTWSSVQLPEIDGVPIKSVGSITCVDAQSCFAIAQDPTSPAGTSQRQLVISTVSPPN